jgi:hypothetical protein
MAIPDSKIIQFAPLSGKFDLDTFVDPTGVPLDVLDAGQAFSLTGRIELPAWLTGLGRVRLFAREIGGPFNAQIGAVNVTLNGAVPPPQTVTYPWILTVPANTLPNPSVASGVYEMTLTFTLENPPGAPTNIAAFFDLGTFLAV